MIDIKDLRERPQWFEEGLAKKKFTCDVAAFLEVDEHRRQKIAAAETAKAAQKAASKEMASMAKGSPEFLAKLAQMKEMSAQVKDLEREASEVEELWKDLLMGIPNVPDASVPVGQSEEDNVVVSEWSEVAPSAHAVPHFDIPWFSQLIDFEAGSKVTGAGFPFYLGDMARLVRALVHFFLEEAYEAGYQEMLPPIFVNAASATATGQLPDKEGQMYEMPNEGLYAVPTAEVPVTNYLRDSILSAADLPLRRCAYTPCFRREAGSWGAHVRGLNRLHQFDKVELVQWVEPATSLEALESLRAHAESLLQKLGLPYRTLLMCSGDIGFPHAKQYDLEVWAAGQQRWLEVSSCSTFTDFQARRANIRYRPAEGKPEFVHTLNASGLAVPRTLAAILENNFNAEGGVVVPEVLRPWVKKDVIVPG